MGPVKDGIGASSELNTKRTHFKGGFGVFKLGTTFTQCYDVIDLQMQDLTAAGPELRHSPSHLSLSLQSVLSLGSEQPMAALEAVWLG